jgi:hypothetical protein
MRYKFYIAALVLFIFALSVTACRQPTFENNAINTERSTSERSAIITEHDNSVYFQVLNVLTDNLRVYRRSSNGELSIIAEMSMFLGNTGFIYNTLFLATTTDGIHKICILDNSIEQISEAGGSDFVFTADWIFGQGQWWKNGAYHGEIFRMRPDGSEFEVISDDGGVGLQLYEGKLYYFSLNDRSVIRINIDGTNREIVFECICSDEVEIANVRYLMRKRNIRIHDGWVYYINHENQLYRIGLDGQAKTNLNAQVYVFELHDSTLVFAEYSENVLQERSSIYLMDLNTMRTQRVTQSGGWILVIAGDYAYSYHIEGQTVFLYRFHISGDGFGQIAAVDM